MIERVWREGGTFQEWGEQFDVRRWEEAMAAEGLSIEWYVFRHREEDEMLPWEHLTAGLHKDFLWQDWQAALAGSASRIAGGRLVTTAASAPATASSTSSPRRFRQPAAARERARISSTVDCCPNPSSRARSSAAARAPSSSAETVGAGMMRMRIRYTKLGKVRFTSHRDMARIWERSMRKTRSPVAVQRRIHSSPEDRLRLGAARGAESLAEYLDVELVERHEPDRRSARW